MALRPVLIAAAARDPFVSELVGLLKSEGREILVTHEAEAALRIARARRPAVVILDAVLPRGDGLSLCRQLKGDATTADIPVFCFSVLVARDRCIEAGADGFMLKPIEQDSLIERIRDVLSSRVRQLPRRSG